MMRYGSVCSGIEAATQAWHTLGWQPVFFSEIEKFPRQVLAHHYPHVPNWGDMTKFRDWPDAAIDVLVGGTPCQSFSVAGLRGGLDDTRGNLMLTYAAIARRYRPGWMVWENVPGVLSSDGGRDFASLLGLLSGRRVVAPADGWRTAGIVEGYRGAYGLAWRVLDAQFVRVDGFPRAVPQRRRRVFIIGYLGDWRRAAAVLFERESLCWNNPPRRETRKATPAPASNGAGSGCAVIGCGRPAEKRGWCNSHYQRWRKHGNVGIEPVNEPGKSDVERFWPKVSKGDGCWEWTAALNEKGYGIFWSNDEGRSVRAHRFSFEQVRGEIPDQLEIDHLCRNRKCVRPDHLDVVTGAENTRRGNAGKHWAQKRGAVAVVAPTIAARTRGGGGLGTDFDCDGGLIVADVAPTLNAHFGDKQGLEDQHINGGGGLFVAHSLRAEGFDASEDGTGRGTSIVPVVARTLTRGAESAGKGGYAGRRQEDDDNLVATPIAFDARQSDVIQYGDKTGPLDTDGHSMAIAIQARLGGKAQGAGFNMDGAAYTLDSQSDTNAVAIPYTLAIRGRGDSHQLEYRQDGTANAILTPNGGRGGIGVGAVAFTCSERSNSFAWESEVYPTLNAQLPNDTSNLQMGVRQGWAVRRLVPEECEALQGFPRGYTDIKPGGKPTADGPRYKALGNSFAVNVVRWLGQRIALVEAEASREDAA